MRRLAAASLLFCAGMARLQAGASSEDPASAARQEAWARAAQVVALLEQGGHDSSEGIAAWLKDYHATADALPATAEDAPFPQIDSDQLVTRNPHFWSAYFEIAPADPALSLLHAALLLAGGEGQRASFLASLALLRANIPEAWRVELIGVVAGAQEAQAGSSTLVLKGEALQEAGDFSGALRQYEAALDLWPANGWASYERGVALRTATLSEQKTGNQIQMASTHAPEAPAVLPEDPPETLLSFARARKDDPFLMMAYQGSEPEIVPRMLALVRTALPIWESIRKHPPGAASREQLRDLAGACREAGIDDYALAVQQLLAARGKRYTSEDLELITPCVGRLAPGSGVTEALTAQLDAPVRLARELVAPAAPAPPPPVVAASAGPQQASGGAAKTARVKRKASEGGGSKKKNSKGR